MGSKTWIMTTMKEVKKVSGVAGPMVAVMVIQSLSQVVSLMMVGHLDALSLAGASIATSFTNVTGFAFLVNYIFVLLNCLPKFLHAPCT